MFKMIEQIVMFKMIEQIINKTDIAVSLCVMQNH